MPIEFVSAERLLSPGVREGTEDAPSDVEVVASKTGGHPVPRRLGKTLHSLYDPKEEARRFVDGACQANGLKPGDAVAVLGNGFGYVTEAFLERGMRPVVFEPDRAVFRAMRARRDCRSLAADAAIFLVDDPDDLYKAGPHRPHLAKIRAVVALPYVPWLYPGFKEAMERKLSAARSAKDAYYKVSVVSPLAGGSLETARYAVQALTELGIPVDFVDVSGFGGTLEGLRKFHAHSPDGALEGNLASYQAWCSERILQRIEAFDPAIVLVLAQAPIVPEHIRRMRESGRRVVFWFVEDCRLFRYWESSAAAFDVFLTIQKGPFLKDLEYAGQPRSHYLPLAADDSVFFPCAPDAADGARFCSPISFMGAGYYNRRRFFHLLLSRPFKIWGTGWDPSEPVGRLVQEDGRRVDSRDTAKIFNGTDINVNLHSSTSHEGVNPFGDFVNPRTFEIAACGAFQLVDRRSLLPELFLPGEEIVCFRDRDDFLKLLDHYLAHPAERRAIAEKGRNRVLAEHTYRERMRELIEVVMELSPPETERRQPLVREMAGSVSDPEWAEIFACFKPDRPLDFDVLLGGIRLAGGPRGFSRKEALILMLGNLKHGGI